MPTASDARGAKSANSAEFGCRANEQSRGGGDVVLVETVFLGRQGGYPVLA